MHLLVLSAFRPSPRRHGRVRVHCVSMHLLVLSAFRRGEAPTSTWATAVSMHLLVLSAFRLEVSAREKASQQESQCTFWCSVLSDLKRLSCYLTLQASQCTFWCSVLSDPVEMASCRRGVHVSMHLLVLSAFRRRFWTERQR